VYYAISFILGFIISMYIFQYKKVNFLKEVWAKLNKFLKESFRNFLKKKIIDNIISYTLYFLIILSSIYAFKNLVSKLVSQINLKEAKETFPFVLEFSEYLFLYFLPLFILFGFLNFYKLEWKRQLGAGNKPDPKAEEKLNLSKKLFFSSVLSYITLKIIDILFFKFEEYDLSYYNMGSIGVFFILILIFIIFTSKKH